MKSKQGFTLIELLAVIVVLAIIVLLAVTAAVPMMNRAKKSSLADEALAYIRAAKQAYTVENMDGQTSACYDISYLNEKYIMKEDNNYQGMVIVSGPINDINFSISLSNGKFYVVKSNASKVTISDVVNSKPNGYAASCGSYNSVLSSGNVNTNSLVYKLIMANGKSTLEANLNDISSRSVNMDFSGIATTASQSGMFMAEDDDGASYYYRGVVNNNWVEFGNFYWRVVRINGDGSIRLIYSGIKTSDHTGTNANIKGTIFGDYVVYNTSVNDVTGLTNNQITVNYSVGRYGNTYAGYMYNPPKTLASYPSYDVGSSHSLNYFYTFANIDDTKEYYLFKNFDMATDCFTGNVDDQTGSCVLKCGKLGEDCILVNWNTQQTNASNYSTSAAGSVTNKNVYTSPFKYTCWGYGTAATRNNSNNTTSVYISCPLVSEIVGTTNATTKAIVKYHGLFAESEEQANTNKANSKIKTEIDSWYETNIYNKKDSANRYYEEYLVDEIFCNDRTPYDSNQPFPLNTNDSYVFAFYRRINNVKTPSFKCPNKGRDGFTLTNVSPTSTVTPRNNGNNMLKYPIGLLTGDEVVYAGGNGGSGKSNTSYYLYTGATYWTMTPYFFLASHAYTNIIYVHTNGYLTNNNTFANYGVRPVINLSSEVLYDSGNGTESSPYTVKLQ